MLIFIVSFLCIYIQLAVDPFSSKQSLHYKRNEIYNPEKTGFVQNT